MIFLESPRVKGYVETSRSIVLDYDVKITPLRQVDRVLSYGSLGNYSLAGFEMILHRYVSHYIITYYLPSGEKEFDQVTNPLPPLSRSNDVLMNILKHENILPSTSSTSLFLSVKSCDQTLTALRS